MNKKLFSCNKVYVIDIESCCIVEVLSSEKCLIEVDLSFSSR